MSWDGQPPIFKIYTDLLQLSMKTARLELVKKLKLLEAQAQVAGLAPEKLAELKSVRAALYAKAPTPEDTRKKVFLSRIRVLTRPGSLF